MSDINALPDSQTEDSTVIEDKSNAPKMSMKLDSFRLLINDFSASIHFWREIVGLELIYQDPTSTYACFQAGSTRLELLKADYFASSLSEAQPVQGGHRGVIVFESDDVDATYADLVERGAPSLASPRLERAGFARIALLTAPDGYILEVFTTLGTFPVASSRQEP